MNNTYWLEGIKAAEDKLPREECPYVKDEDPCKAFNWFQGYDTAHIILVDLGGRKIE